MTSATTTGGGGGGGKKEFGDGTRSRLSEIYRTLDRIPDRNPSVRIDDDDGNGNDDATTMRELLDDLASQQPFVSSRRKRATLDVEAAVKPDDVLRICRLLDTKRRDSAGVTAKFVNVSRNPRVKFWDASFKKKGDQRCYYPPRMLVDLSGESIEPGSSVRCNTGYVIKIPTYANARSVGKSGDSIVEGKRAKQPDFVIVPLITCLGDAVIVPAITPRDPDDDGLLTVNFTLLSGRVDSLRVVFNAYLTSQPYGSVDLVDAEPNAQIFKAKDARSGRLVKNLKVKACFDLARLRDDDGSLEMPTFNALVSPCEMYERQRVVVHGRDVLLSSRKREWQDEDLLTLSGYYDAGDASRFVAPIVVERERRKNTHCLTFIESRCTLFSDQAERTYDLKLLNGAFFDMPNYETIYKSVKQLIDGTETLALGYATCLRLKEKRPSLDLQRAMLLYDYHRRVIDNDGLDERLMLTEKEMYDTRPQELNVCSSNVRKALLTLRKARDERRRKRKADDDDDDNNEVATDGKADTDAACAKKQRRDD